MYNFYKNRISGHTSFTFGLNIFIFLDFLDDFQITSEKIVSAVIKRIRLVNPILNAIVEERFDQALQEAKIVDQKIKQLDEKEIKKLASSHPLLGVPITIKESCSVKGKNQIIE